MLNVPTTYCVTRQGRKLVKLKWYIKLQVETVGAVDE